MTIVEPDSDRPVSTIELFFDLVFVFAITQLTAVLVDRPTLLGVVQVLLIFAVLWWMFGGYVWLTNALAPDRPLRRIFLLGAMIGFLVIALAIPTAFASGGVVFGLGYLLVVLIHAGLFVHGQAGSGITRVIPIFAVLNLLAALILLGAGFATGPIVYVLWVLAFGIFVVTSILAGSRGFQVVSGHFVERHGLLLIIVLGESVVAISVGAADLPLDASLLVAAVLALAVVSCLWWLYFSGDDVHAEEALARAPLERRARIALNAFFYAQIPMLLGVIGFAAGVKSAIGHAFEPLPLSAALFLASGVALYLVGDALFRIGIGWGQATGRLLAALAALATAPIGLLNASLQLVVLLAILLVAIVVQMPASRRYRSAAAGRWHPKPIGGDKEESL